MTGCRRRSEDVPPRPLPPGGVLHVAGGESLHLLPERAVVWPACATLFVADVHVGKDEALRAGGLPIPPGSTSDDLDRLADLVIGSGVRRLIVLGDFLHARTSRAPRVLDELRSWRDRLSQVEVVLVRGNHDRSAGDPPVELGFEVVPEGWREGPFHLVHDPEHPTSRDAPWALAGHLHPAVRLRGVGGDRLRTMAFVERNRTGGRTLILPAWSTFTGGARIDPGPGDRIWAVGPGAVVEIPVRPGRAR